MNSMTKKFQLVKQYPDWQKKFDEADSIEDAPQNVRPITLRIKETRQLALELFFPLYEHHKHACHMILAPHARAHKAL